MLLAETSAVTPELARLRADPTLASLRRSLEVYYGDPGREARLDEFYARFVRPGDRAFDIGAHVGDRTGSFRRLGATVVAVEPQPLCGQVLRTLYGGDEQVTVVPAACGAAPGPVRLHVNSANPTVSTASAGFVRAAADRDGWREQVWDGEITVPGTTLDALLATHGTPSFTKIDVEGGEEQVLAGLSRPLPALSFEFTTIHRSAAVACLRRLARLGTYGFDMSLGESLTLVFDRWVPPQELMAYLHGIPDSANSGDIYCLLLSR